MASSILAGDRRWASGRKSGMTVLGKVPKPINLPSQRLENNGVDPNVEIVPKGTLSWGQKSSSSVPNAWGSPSLFSPKADGSSGSPSHGNGRPSSGGSGTRPSTASSDRSQDPLFNTWGPNSRPSSSSRLLSSNHAPVATSRPRSAETRPGSSQLSRFAENFGEASGAWAANKTVQKLASTTSRTGDFSLSSGDFPTLGSEKVLESHMQRGHSSQGRPTSSSGIGTRPKEKLERPRTGDGYRDHENLGVSTTDKDLYAGDNGQSRAKLQHGLLTQPLPSINVGPGQFEPWHGPPVRPPDAVWYRGPACAPYGASGPPGSFRADQFAYYPPQFPPTSEPVPRPGSGRGGYHPINGEPYRPQLPPNSYIVPSHPVIPARPGVYAGPLPYDGYFHQHQAGGFVEQQAPRMLVSNRPGGYNMGRNPDSSLNSGQLEARPSVHEQKLTKGQSQSDTAHSFPQAEYKVLLKQNDGWHDNHLREVSGQILLPSHSHFDKELKQGGFKQEGKHPADAKKNDVTECEKLGPDYHVPSQPRKHAANPVTISPERDTNKFSEGILRSKPGSTALVNEQHPGVRKNTLIEKIEGLNNKFRSTDSRNEIGVSSFKPDKLKQPKVTNAKPNQSTEFSCSDVENAGAVSCQGIPDSVEANALNTSNSFKSSSCKTVVQVDSSELKEKSRFHVQKKAHSPRGRVDSIGKSNSHAQVNVYWAKESSGRDSSVMFTKGKFEGALKDGLVDCSSNEAFSKESKELDVSAISEPVAPSDSLDYEAQRAKLKELAAQRAKQLQKEEEERTREQKAKALAKLEELNRRSAAQSWKEKSNDATSSSTDNKPLQHDFEDCSAPKADVSVENKADGYLVAVADENKRQSSNKDKKSIGSSDVASNTSRVISEYPSISRGSSIPMGQETNAIEVSSEKDVFVSHSHDKIISKHREVGYRTKTEVSLEKHRGEKPISIENMEGSKEEILEEKPAFSEKMENLKDLVEATAPASNYSKVTQNDTYVQPKKKNGRNSRYKNKMDEVIASSTSPPVSCVDNLDKRPGNVHKTEPAVPDAEVKLASTEGAGATNESQGSNDVVAASSELGLFKLNQEVRGRTSHQWRRASRNHQGNKATDKLHGNETVIWAPIKAPNKSEQSDESSHINLTENNYQSTKKDQGIHNGTKTKRAELERYVPKPAAKEIYHQENLQQHSPVGNAACESTSEKPNLDSKNSGMGRLGESSAGKQGFVSDTTKTNEENKPAKHGKAYTSWHQRFSSESTSLQNSTENVMTYSTESFSNTAGKDLPGKLDNLSEAKIISDCVEGENHLISCESTNHPAMEKDHGATSRQMRQQMKIHRVAGNYAAADDKHMDGGNSTCYPGTGVGTPGARNLSRAENNNTVVVHARTQWKPKSHPYANTSKGNGEREAALDPITPNKEINTEKSKRSPVEIANAVDEEVKGNEKATSMANSLGESYHNLSHDVLTEVDASITKNEQQASHVPRQHGHHSGHFGRVREASYRGRPQGRDSRKQNLHTNVDKMKNNTHLEYQPVGSTNKPINLHWSSDADQGAQEVCHVPAHRYRERGDTQPRRNGRFVRRGNAVAVNVDNSHGGRE